MGERVIVVASGETERRAIPKLLRHLDEGQVRSLEVRTPLAGSMTMDRITRVIRSAYFDITIRSEIPLKFIILVDAEAHTVDETAARYVDLPSRVSDLGIPVLLAVAKWHLEAWFFADAQGLRNCLGRSLGRVDTSRPDEIRNPKQHLRAILGDPYTSLVAERVASSISPVAVRERSPSFVHFEAQVLNGNQ